MMNICQIEQLLKQDKITVYLNMQTSFLCPLFYTLVTFEYFKL